MSLHELLQDDTTSISDVAAYLDGLDHAARMEETMAANKSDQVAMWEKAAAAERITFDHFVKPGTPALQEVIHHGRNTLPAFKLFQKRFCLPADREGELYGYNHAPTKGLIGPGFFVAVNTAGNAEWEARGGVVVDYFQVPSTDVPEEWPTVVPNSKGLQMFVYNKTRDFMRKVSEHVSIGAAFKKGKPLGAYFVLCREDVA